MSQSSCVAKEARIARQAVMSFETTSNCIKNQDKHTVIQEKFDLDAKEYT